MAYMYILECIDGTYYTGSTIDLEKRFYQHQSGEGARYTSKRIPVELVYCEFYKYVSDAFRREKQIQKWSHNKKRALIESQYSELGKLAKKEFN